MSTVPTAVETQSIVDAWPRGDVGLPASVAACYTAWMTQNLPVIDPAIAAFLTAAPGYVTPARFNKAEKCRVLVANAVPPLLLRPCPAALFACIYSTARPAVMRASSPINTRDFPLPTIGRLPDKISSQPHNKSRITYYPISY